MFLEARAEGGTAGGEGCLPLYGTAGNPKV